MDILRAEEENEILALLSRDMQHIDADGYRGPHQHIQNAVGCLQQRILDVRVGNDHADEYDGREAGGIRLADKDSGVQGNDHAHAHQRIEHRHALAQGGKYRNEQQEEQAPERADQGAGDAVYCVFPGVMHIWLHADDGGDGRFSGHVLAAVSAQGVKQQAQRHCDAGFDDALAHRGEVDFLG